ncbi:9108_t:CDS:2 [Funneliformis geosporum]|uniref:11647_t:CDS:1 n=1 Tax=Funneliformis geosporum TaxID=1117311 RepID=A0A9W4WXT9_9GLOM|nr:11647_t:CDS:2 [Funneliformis geosporum]CAI2186825.1 9108_t:CDS:2 [Funneliformis geosporum]
MAINRRILFSNACFAVVFFVVIILCQFVACAPIDKKNIIPERISVQLSGVEDVEIKFSTYHEKLRNTLMLDLPELPEIPELPDLPKLPELPLKDVAKIFIVLIIAIIGMAFLYYFPKAIIVGIVRLLGFGIKGIVKGSFAAFYMARYGGKVAVNSVCAILQSIGARGL